MSDNGASNRSSSSSSPNIAMAPRPLLTPWMIDVVAGWVSGATAIAACQPVDTILTRLQATSSSASISSISTTGTATSTGSGALSIVASNVVSESVVSPRVAAAAGEVAASTMALSRSAANATAATSAVWRTTGLWRGSWPMMTVVPLQNGLLMGGYGMGTRWYGNTTGDDVPAHDSADSKGTSNANLARRRRQQLTAIFVGGCVGGVLQSFLMAPVEWIKVQQQTMVSSSIHAGTTTSPNNAAALWAAALHRHSTTGLTATLLRDGIPHGVWFVAYDVCKATMLMAATVFYAQARVDSENYIQSDTDMAVAVPASVSLLSGAVAATVAWLVGYPADIIKTRIQAAASVASASAVSTTGSSGSGGSLSSSSSLGVLDTARQLIHEANGNIVAAMYRGFGLKLLRSIPASMIGFTVYEHVAHQLLLQQQQV